MFTKKYWMQVLERAVKTFLQAFAAASGLGVTELANIPWQSATSIAVGATLLSVVTSILTVNVGPEGSPSMVETADKGGDVESEIRSLKVMVESCRADSARCESEIRELRERVTSRPPV